MYWSYGDLAYGAHLRRFKAAKAECTHCAYTQSPHPDGDYKSRFSFQAVLLCVAVWAARTGWLTLRVLTPGMTLGGGVLFIIDPCSYSSSTAKERQVTLATVECDQEFAVAQDLRCNAIQSSDSFCRFLQYSLFPTLSPRIHNPLLFRSPGRQDNKPCPNLSSMNTKIHDTHTHTHTHTHVILSGPAPADFQSMNQ